MVPIKQLFHIRYGNQFDFSKMDVSEKGINFISRGSTNNGYIAKVLPYGDVEPFPAGLITVTMGGSYLLASFVQPSPFYTAQNIKVLTPKNEMDLATKLFYCAAIQHNRFRYHSHSREANSTFDDILVPDINEVPSWVTTHKISILNNERMQTKDIMLNVQKWEWFRYDIIFDIRKGFYNKKPENHTGNEIPFIGAIDNNNGVSEYYDILDIEEASKTGDEKNVSLNEKIFDGNCITVSNNGSVGYAFYQKKPFTCSHDVNPLYLNRKWNKELNPYLAMFLCSIIEKERYRWTYGRKWRPKRMPSSLIKLPVDSLGNPDWAFMEDYIKSLPYSANLRVHSGECTAEPTPLCNER